MAARDAATYPASSVNVVIPWRPGCGHREAALRYVVGRWAELGYDCTLGEYEGEGRWCKALAVQRGIDATDREFLIIADADVWCDGMQDLVKSLLRGSPWVVPHRMVHRLSQDATMRVLAGEAEPNSRMPLDVLKSRTHPLGRPYVGRLGGGIVGLPRRIWDECPLDQRFKGWGHEDESWALALEHLYGPANRHDARLWHLWHPPQERIAWGLGSVASDELFKRYHMAATNRDRSEMRSLLDEGSPRRASCEG